MNTANKISPSDLLAMQFLEHAKQFNANSELIKVLKSITYSIVEANVLVRAASEGNRRYFFGLNYLTVEEIANLDNPFISFICGSIEKIIIIPEYAFEVELSIGVWSGVGRMATLIDYSNVNLYVVANDSKKYNQVITSLYENYNRYHFVANESLGDLYATEKNLRELRYNIGL